MKRLIIKLILFLSPIIILAYPLDLLLSHTLSKVTSHYEGEFEVWNDIYSGKIDVDIAIYGSSRAWIHINPTIIEDTLQKTAYNFGLDGHNSWLQYLRHLEYIQYNKKPTTIIYSVDVFTLQKRYDLYNLEQFLPYMYLNKNIYNYTSSYEGFDKCDYFIPLVRYTGKQKNVISSLAAIFQEESPRYRYRGFLGNDREWNADFEKAKVRNGTYQAKLYNNSIVLFESFIKECKNNNIELILVYTPEYIDGQKYVENRDEIFLIFNNFAQKYDLLFLDYSDDDISFNRDLFYNASHLNKTGANLFTTKLAHDLKMRKHNQ